MAKASILLRFLFGGIAVALSYVLSDILPWKVFGGIFAAFPAVMVVSVMMMGWKDSSEKASETAQGSVFGMIGCTVCVLVVLATIHFLHNWWLGVGVGIVAWYVSAVSLYRLAHRRRA